MFNVLPDNFKEIIKSQYKSRRLVVWLIACVCVEMAFLIALLPSYVYLFSEENSLMAESSSSEVKQLQDSNDKTKEVILNVNKELGALSLGISSVDINTIIPKVLSLKGPDIVITEISYQSQTTSTSTLTISGVASSREALLSLAKRFEADSLFENVDLPVSNFAKDKNIDFSMNMSVSI